MIFFLTLDPPVGVTHLTRTRLATWMDSYGSYECGHAPFTNLNSSASCCMSRPNLPFPHHPAADDCRRCRVRGYAYPRGFGPGAVILCIYLIVSTHSYQPKGVCIMLIPSSERTAPVNGQFGYCRAIGVLCCWCMCLSLLTYALLTCTYGLHVSIRY